MRSSMKSSFTSRAIMVDFFCLTALVLFVYTLHTVPGLIPTAQAACSLHENGNGSVSGVGCTIAAQTVEGTDTCTVSEAAGVANTSTLTITSAITMNDGTAQAKTTLIAGKLSIGSGGSISLSTGANVQVRPGAGLWVTDGEADGWAATGFPLFSATASGKRRMCLMRSDTTVDCNDAAFSTTNTCYPAFSPYGGFYPSQYGGFSPYGSFYPQFSP